MPDKQNQPNTSTVSIPQFMSDTEDNTLQATESIRKNASNLYKLMLGISILWVLIVVIYISQFFGWSNLFLMMPDEFGGFLAGISLPLAVIWMVIAYIDRGVSFKQEAKLLHAYMNQLVYPEEGAPETHKAMADAIKAQVVELRQATKEATDETNKIKSELGQHVTDFSKLVSILQGYSGTTMNELNEGVKLMTQGLDYINDKVTSATDSIEAKINTFSSSAATLKANIEEVSNSLNTQINELQKSTQELSHVHDNQQNIISLNSDLLSNCSNKLTSDFDNIRLFINQESSRLEKLSNTIVNHYQDIYKQLSEKASIVEKSFSVQVNQLTDYVKNINQTSLISSEKFEEFRRNLNQEVDSIIARSKSISDLVEMKVQDLSGLAETINLNMDNVEQHIGEKINKLQSISQQAVSEIVSASETFDSKIASLNKEQINSMETTKALRLELEEQNTSLTTTAQNIQSIIKPICEQMLNDINLAKTSGDTLVEDIKKAETLLSQQNFNLSEISDNLNTQSKLNSSVIEQQQKLFTTALSKIECGKDVLKQQLDDLMRMTNAIDDEAINAVKRMNSELSTSLQKSTEIAQSAGNISNQINNQTQNLELLSEQVLAKAADFSVEMRESENSLDSLIQNIVTRAENVASLLEAQVNAINSATENSGNKHNRLVELFNQQSSILNNTAENTAQYVADLVQSLDEKAETLNLLFRNQQSEFFSICDKMSENTSNISNTLKNQISLLEQSSDRVFNRMTGFEEEFSKKAEILNTTSNNTIDRLMNVSEMLKNQNQEIEQSMNIINDKVKTIGSEMGTVIGDFTNNIKAIKDESSIAGNEIASTCNKLKDSGRSLLADSRNVIQVIEGQVKILDNNLSKVKLQSEQISDNFSKQKDSIADVVNLVSTQTRLGEASLAQQYKYLSDTANDVSAKMKEIEGLFQSNTASILDSSSKYAFEVNTLSDRIIKAGEDVKKTVKQSVGELEAVSISLNNTADNIVDTVNNTHQKVDGVINKYQNHIANFNTVTAEASSGVVEVNNLITQQNDKMIKISEDTKNLVSSFNSVLNEASNQISKRANGAFEQIKKVSAQLKELGLQLEDSTQLTAKHMDNAGEKMRASINEIAANAERISNDIRTSGEVFLKQSDVLMNTTDETINKVSTAMEYLKTGSEDLTSKGKMWLEQTDEFTKVFEKQSEIIDTTSLKATENLRKLEAKFQEVQVDSFLKDAAELFEHMETLAIDINRIFNPTTEEEIWKKYYSGDTAVFVRYLAKIMTKSQVNAIRKEYEENADFRSLVNNYVASFETLITKAKGNERAGVLLSVISGSDVGKVYYVIAKALDKLN